MPSTQYSRIMTTIVLACLLPLTHGKLIDVPSMPSGFQGQQSGIGSWYRANTDQDSTNGRSWCGIDYSDSSPVFAPDLTKMGGATYDSDPVTWQRNIEMWCGLEAEVKNPTNGKTMILYIGDAFDPKWVLSPGSIDIMLGAYEELDEDPGGDKNVVIKGVEWRLTGKRETEWSVGEVKEGKGGSEGRDGGKSESSGREGYSGGAESSKGANGTTRTSSRGKGRCTYRAEI